MRPCRREARRSLPIKNCRVGTSSEPLSGQHSFSMAADARGASVNGRPADAEIRVIGDADVPKGCDRALRHRFLGWNVAGSTEPAAQTADASIHETYLSLPNPLWV